MPTELTASDEARVWREDHDERMAVYWGREDDTIYVIACLTHYVHKIANESEDTLEFVSSVGDRIIVALSDEERRQMGRAG